MAETLKVLGQIDMPMAVLTPFYTVPSATQTVVSTLYVANRTGSPAHFRISVAIGGVADNPNQYIYYDISIPNNETFASTTGITMGAGDVLRGYSDIAGLTFQAFGAEKTQ
jgi:hypothetical protein